LFHIPFECWLTVGSAPVIECHQQSYLVLLFCCYYNLFINYYLAADSCRHGLMEY